MSSTSINSSVTTASELWDSTYVDEEHIQAFAQALDISDAQALDNDVLSPTSPRSPPLSLDSPDAGKSSESKSQTWKYGPDNGALSGGPRVEKLTATSDFAPIHQRVSRRKTPSAQGLTYHLIRWPLLAFIFLIISIEFGAYVLTRQSVNVFEWLVAWRGYKSKLRRAMRNAKTYDEWVEAAKRMDEHLGFDYWKESDDDSYADTILIKRVYKTLRKFRAAKDTRGLMDALAVCVRTNFAGTEGPKMYSETFFGTKRIVEAHVAEVAASIDFVRTATDVSLEEKRAFFRAINKNYGSSALCLSGGASFGYYHFGVIKAFLEADLLPRVITGTSAGGLVAALLCTRTNDELKELLVPKLADKITACEDPITVWFKRFIQTGARFSTLEWARKSMFFTRGSLTFKEAYQRTGRALNVSVVPSDRHSPTILLNHLTAPNCLIWSAILASAAVPGILNPVVLMAKDRDGQIKPHNLGGSRFKDGSLREDIPLGSLHTQFNCNFSIVSQTNPHIHLFFFAPRGSVGRPVAHRKGKGWRGGFILSALESYIKLDLSKHFKVIRDLDLMPQILQSDWSGVFLQRFSGDLTLTPRSTISDWFRLLSDPDRKQLERMLTVGRRVTWPALHMVSNRMKIERAILRGRTEVRTALQRDLTTNDPESPRPPIADSDANPIPIESDADAGFASRSRRNKGQRVQYLPEADSFNYNSTSPYRRRKPPQRNRRDFPAASEPPQPPSPPEGMLQNRSYSGALGETFRHVRASSLSAFGVKLSPFRSVRPTNGNGNGHEPARRSQLSISRWFGNASESSSEEDDDGQQAHAESASGPSGDDTPIFRVNGGDDDVIVDEPDSSGEEGTEPIPGGEPVSAQQINAGAAAGERFRPSYAYSPPSQDH